MGGGGGGEPLVRGRRPAWGGARTHLRILSSNTASPPLFVLSCPQSCVREGERVSASASRERGESRGAAVTKFARPRTHHLRERLAPLTALRPFTFLAEGALGRAEGRLLAERLLRGGLPHPEVDARDALTPPPTQSSAWAIFFSPPAGGPARAEFEKSEATCVRSSAASQRPTRRVRGARAVRRGSGRARTLGARRARRRARGLKLVFLGRARNDTPFPRGGGGDLTSRAFTTRWRSRAGARCRGRRAARSAPSASPRGTRRSRSFSAR